MPGARLVFQAAERAVPALQRGWRTPDPSPTRAAADLPGCTWNLCCTEDEPSTPKLIGGHRREEARSRMASRTPSPEPLRRHEPTGVQKMPFGQWATWSLEDNEGDVLSWATRSDEALALDTSSSSASPPDSQTAESEDELQSPPPPPPPVFVLMPFMPNTACGSSFPAQFAPGAPGIWTLPGSGCEETTPSEATSDLCRSSEECPSKGSIGHPFTCANFCKYARKSRGCKDGAACDHCHLCTQKREVAMPARRSRLGRVQRKKSQ
mmetsp:Transcript_98197/g.247823  ORF Transcript_98197/g.247823 Transcript_98197/m.247823 type:complete len:266 (+) Transcript_98197:63-860(+)